ncbi:EAL domain-containing protein [Brevibacillus dissolubilis]|uniref:EAL domain-containing protein n=1 Tax=Brevibacillus dissolubilis TaxID=1844116 RepID=UPI00111755FB|nr:EAL domain-containing protein [Brevibacillus dissolubilis]
MDTQCDACQVSERGYTLYFKGDLNTDWIKIYLGSYSSSSWLSINDRMHWVEESIFYNMLDYITNHLSSHEILAVMSKRTDPLAALDQLKPVAQFLQEREADWIDSLITEQSILTYYQPIVGFQDQQPVIIGHELLSRGIDKQGGIIPPFRMFEAAKIRNRLFALDRACRITSVKNASAIPNQLAFINFLPTAIYTPEHCLQSTLEASRLSGVRPEQLVFEVVESDEIKNVDHLKSILQFYKDHGFKFALDDVGTGYTSLSLLSQLEPDYVKLALEFTRGVSQDRGKQRIARSVLQLAHEMNSQALAEGVEDQEDLKYLLDMGYDLFQGYLFAKPQAHPLLQLAN